MEEEDKSKRGHRIFSSDRFNIFNGTDRPFNTSEAGHNKMNEARPEASESLERDASYEDEDGVHSGSEDYDMEDTSERSEFAEQPHIEKISNNLRETDGEDIENLEESDKEEEVDWHKILQSNKHRPPVEPPPEEEDVHPEDHNLRMKNLKSYDVGVDCLHRSLTSLSQLFRGLRRRRFPPCTWPAQQWTRWTSSLSRAT